MQKQWFVWPRYRGTTNHCEISLGLLGEPGPANTLI